jgi:hypothetical protein
VVRISREPNGQDRRKICLGSVSGSAEDMLRAVVGIAIVRVWWRGNAVEKDQCCIIPLPVELD